MNAKRGYHVERAGRFSVVHYDSDGTRRVVLANMSRAAAADYLESLADPCACEAAGCVHSRALAAQGGGK